MGKRDFVILKFRMIFEDVSHCNNPSSLFSCRYLAICHTLEFRMTKRAARIAIAFIWSTAIGLMSPWAVYYQHIRWGNLYICQQVWPWQHMEEGYFLGAIFLACYSLPLILISICYTLIALRVWNRDAPGIVNTSQAIYRSKVKVLKMLVVVVIMFAFSWLPLYASNMRLYFGPELVDTSTEFVLLSQIILPIAQWLGSANSCVNPIIYCFFSKKFRRGFQEFIHCCKARQHNYFTPTSSHYRTVNNGHSQYPMHLYSSVKVAGGPDAAMLDQHETDDTTCI